MTEISVETIKQHTEWGEKLGALWLSPAGTFNAKKLLIQHALGLCDNPKGNCMAKKLPGFETFKAPMSSITVLSWLAVLGEHDAQTNENTGEEFLTMLSGMLQHEIMGTPPEHKPLHWM